MHSLIRLPIKLISILVVLALSGCASVGVTPETMASMSDDSICEMSGSEAGRSNEEQSAIQAELDRRGVVCDDGKVVESSPQQQTATAPPLPQEQKSKQWRYFCVPIDVSLITETETTTLDGYEGGWLSVDETGGKKRASLAVKDPAGKRVSFHGAYDHKITEEKRKEYGALGYDASVMVFSNRHLSNPDAKVLMMVHAMPNGEVHASALKKQESADLLLQLPCVKPDRPK